MKLQKLTLLLTSIAMLASCGGGSSAASTNPGQATSEPATSEPATSTPADVGAESLDWLDNGKLYFDLRLSEGFSFDGLTLKVDGNPVETGKAVAFDNTKPLSFSFEGEPSDKYYVYYVQARLEEGKTTVDARVNEGIMARADHAKFFGKVAGYLEGATKFYLCVTNTEKNWDKTLSENMNEFINKQFNPIPF